MVLLKAAILGILQGLTEFLPISSSAHLVIGERLLHFSDPGAIFNTTIQLGSILAVAWIYRAKLINMITGLSTRPEARHFAGAIVVATIPALIAGALFAGFVKRILYNSPRVWAIAFIVGGVVMLLLERRQATPVVERAEDTPLPRALAGWSAVSWQEPPRR